MLFWIAKFFVWLLSTVEPETHTCDDPNCEECIERGWWKAIA